MRWLMRLAVCLLAITASGGSAASTPDPGGGLQEGESSTSGWGRVTVPGGTWIAAIRLGYQDPRDSSGSHLAAHLDLGVGLSDRVELRPLALAVRLGSPETAEVLLQVGSKGGFGFIGWDFIFFPTVGAQGILPVGRGNRLIFGGEVSTLATGAEPLTFFAGKVYGNVSGGWGLKLGDRFLLTPGIAAGYDWGRVHPLDDRIARSMNAFVEFGSVVAFGGAPLPLISFRLTDGIAIDGLASVRLDEGLPPLTRTLGGFRFWF